MQRITTMLGVLVLAAAAVVLATAGLSAADKPEKLTICHRTHSQQRPYVKISVSGVATPTASRAVRAHLNHHEGDVVIAAGADCPSTALTTQAQEQQQENGAEKTTICHRTHSQKNPYVKITVGGVATPTASRAVRAHLNNHEGDMVIDAQATCPTTAATTAAATEDHGQSGNNRGRGHK